MIRIKVLHPCLEYQHTMYFNSAVLFIFFQMYVYMSVSYIRLYLYTVRNTVELYTKTITLYNAIYYNVVV